MGKSKEVVQIQDQSPRVDGELRPVASKIAPCDCSEPIPLLWEIGVFYQLTRGQFTLRLPLLRVPRDNSVSMSR
jgi:hypothetical protein